MIAIRRNRTPLAQPMAVLAVNLQAMRYEQLAFASHNTYVPVLALVLFIPRNGASIDTAPYDFRNNGLGWHETNRAARIH
jgi:hypothetical protein